MPGQASLPTDVLLQVVDDLRDDPSTLRHCALACRTLYDCVRPILFNIITIDEPWTSRASQLSNLLDSSPSESLGALVKHLKIVGPEGNPVEHVLAPEDVLIVADKLPDVRILTLEFVAFDWLEDLFTWRHSASTGYWWETRSTDVTSIPEDSFPIQSHQGHFLQLGSLRCAPLTYAGEWATGKNRFCTSYASTRRPCAYNHS